MTDVMSRTPTSRRRSKLFILVDGRIVTSDSPHAESCHGTGVVPRTNVAAGIGDDGLPHGRSHHDVRNSRLTAQPTPEAHGQLTYSCRDGTLESLSSPARRTPPRR
jgi:hypothetical protein